MTQSQATTEALDTLRFVARLSALACTGVWGLAARHVPPELAAALHEARVTADYVADPTAAPITVRPVRRTTLNADRLAVVNLARKMSLMGDELQGTVSRLVHELQNGNRAAFDELFPLIYDELRALARRQRRRWRADTTLNTTALVHELYLKLEGQKRIGSNGRAHFFAVAAKAMRHILSNYAREQRAKKRGDGVARVSLDEMTLPPEEPHAGLSEEQADMLIELEEALRCMERVDKRGSEVVECRFYGGMTVEETAAALGISPRTVKRDWRLAQAWLHRETKLHM